MSLNINEPDHDSTDDSHLTRTQPRSGNQLKDTNMYRGRGLNLPSNKIYNNTPAMNAAALQHKLRAQSRVKEDLPVVAVERPSKV